MATLKRTSSAVLAPRSESAGVVARAAPPQLLRFLVVSLSAERRRLIRAAAEAQAWEAIACRDAGEFLRVAFKRSVPLIVVDLPSNDSPEYWELRHATDRVRQTTQSLVVVAGSEAATGEELWARCLGAWAYLSEANSQRGFEFMLKEARDSIERHRTPLTANVGIDGW
jgi:uncharacterized protein (DUF3084 family)